MKLLVYRTKATRATISAISFSELVFFTSSKMSRSSKGEAYSGQHEINIQYADALTAADQHVLFKHGAKEISIQEGYSITFMAKPHHKWTGSSGHLHISMWDLEAKQNLFYDPQSEPYHMSEKMQHFLGGVIAYTREFSQNGWIENDRAN